MSPGWNGRGHVPAWKCDIHVHVYGRGGALMWRSEGHPLVTLHVEVEVGVHLLVTHVAEGETTGGDGSPDVEEQVASTGGLVVHGRPNMKGT